MTTFVTLTPRAMLGLAAGVLLALCVSTAGASAATVRADQTHRLQLDLRAAAGTGTSKVQDEHCGGIYISCDHPAFIAYCAKHGGTISGPQRWGGKTCFMPS